MTSKIRKNIVKVLPKTQFSRSIGMLVGGAVSSQALGVLAAPLLTRLYTPENFGLLAVFVGLLSLFGVMASLRYELAIPLPKNDIEAGNLVAVSLILVAITTVAATAIVTLFGQKITHTLDVPSLSHYMWLLPIGVLLTGSFNVFKYWAIRSKNFSSIARTGIKQSLTGTLIQILGHNFGSLNLLISQSISQSLGTFTLGKEFYNQHIFKQLSWIGIRQQAIRYKRFPLYSTWEGIFNTAGTQLPLLLFSALFSPAAAGLYSLANRVLTLPMSLIGNAIGQVFFSNAAQAHREGHLSTLVAKLHSKLANIGLPPALLMVLAGPNLFAWVFGEKWREAGEMARWMTPWLYLQFVSSPLSTISVVLELQTQGLIFQVTLLIFRLIAIYAGSSTGDLYLTIIYFSAASSICYFFILLWIGISSGNRICKILSPYLRAALFSILCSLPFLISIYVANNLWAYGFLTSVGILSLYLFYETRRSHQ